jgi:TatD DNase family protein
MSDAARPRLIDSHCHLADERFAPDREQVLARARAAGVVAMVCVGAHPGEWDAVLALAAAEPDVHAALGVHPHHAAAAAGAWQALRPLARAGRLVALGEIGLDYHYDFAPRDRQRDAFAAQLALAQELDLPIIIHEREAADDLLAILDREGCPPGVWHCFAGGPDLAAEALGRGLHLGFGGLVTFPKGTEGIRAAARLCPRQRLLLETDAPYLAPVPHRGRRNEPAFLADTARFLAELRGEGPLGGEAAAALFGL